jgi:hypothetical protein
MKLSVWATRWPLSSYEKAVMVPLGAVEEALLPASSYEVELSWFQVPSWIPAPVHDAQLVPGRAPGVASVQLAMLAAVRPWAS